LELLIHLRIYALYPIPSQGKANIVQPRRFCNKTNPATNGRTLFAHTKYTNTATTRADTESAHTNECAPTSKTKNGSRRFLLSVLI